MMRRRRRKRVWLPDSLKEALRARGAENGRSEAEVIRAAIGGGVRAGAPPGPGNTPGPGVAAGTPVAGRLVGIGVGPGEADLVTVRAVEALLRADRVVAPAAAVDAGGRGGTVVRPAGPGPRGGAGPVRQA